MGDRGDGEVGMRKIGGMALTPDWTSYVAPIRDTDTAIPTIP